MTLSDLSIRSQTPAAAWLFAMVLWLAWMGSGTGVQAQASKVSKSERALANLLAQYREEQRLFANDLERIAQACEERGLNGVAPRIRQLAVPLDPSSVRFEPLPRQVQAPIPVPADGEFSWQLTLRQHRKEYAATLDRLATQAIKAGLPSLAFQWIREVALHDPDHPRARRLLGFVRYKDEWVSPFEAMKLKRNEVWTKQWGWLPASYVARYENGERLNGVRWVSAERDAELRSDFNKGWVVRTEHYQLQTNHSLEFGVALASSLEEFHRFFEQTFAGFFYDAKRIQALFDNPTAATRAALKPFQVHYFRSKDEYVSRLQHKPYRQHVAITNGVYDTDDQIVYSFFNPEQPEAVTTLYHEATHQLLAAHLRPSPVIAKEENFWLIEGIACYIESFQRQDGEVSLGNPKYERFLASRYRHLVDGYRFPLERFVAMGQDEFQRHPQIQNNYSLASGLVHFFMHASGGRYRDALIEHLRQLYQQAETGRRPASLEELTGVDFADLDAEYDQYVRRLSRALGEEFAPPP
jgi:hypothetical protein